MDISVKSLFIKPSQLSGAGKGLFTRVAIKKGDRIVEYKGKLMLWKVVKPQDGYNAYLLRLNKTTALDARPYLKTLGRYANDAMGVAKIKGIRNNAEYLTYGMKCFIVATRSIEKGEEILVRYGREFWLLQKESMKKKLLPGTA